MSRSAVLPLRLASLAAGLCCAAILLWRGHESQVGTEGALLRSVGWCLLAVGAARVAVWGSRVPMGVLAPLLLPVPLAVLLGSCPTCGAGSPLMKGAEIGSLGLLCLTWAACCVALCQVRYAAHLKSGVIGMSFLASLASPAMQLLAPRLCFGCLVSLLLLGLVVDHGLDLQTAIPGRAVLAWASAPLAVLLSAAVVGAHSPVLGAPGVPLQDLTGFTVGSLGPIHSASGAVVLVQPGCRYCSECRDWVEANRLAVTFLNPCTVADNSGCWDREKFRIATPAELWVRGGIVRSQVTGWSEGARQYLLNSSRKGK